MNFASVLKASVIKMQNKRRHFSLSLYCAMISFLCVCLNVFSFQTQSNRPIFFASFCFQFSFSFISPSTWKNAVFATRSLEILGHRILTTGTAPTANHAAEFEICPPPQNIKQLQRFHGMVNFYRHFFPNCAQVLKPLTNLLRGGGGEPKRWSGPFLPRRHSKMLSLLAVASCPKCPKC